MGRVAVAGQRPERQDGFSEHCGPLSRAPSRALVQLAGIGA